MVAKKETKEEQGNLTDHYLCKTLLQGHELVVSSLLAASFYHKRLLNIHTNDLNTFIHKIYGVDSTRFPASSITMTLFFYAIPPKNVYL